MLSLRNILLLTHEFGFIFSQFFRLCFHQSLSFRFSCVQATVTLAIGTKLFLLLFHLFKYLQLFGGVSLLLQGTSCTVIWTVFKIVLLPNIDVLNSWIHGRLLRARLSLGLFIYLNSLVIHGASSLAKTNTSGIYATVRSSAERVEIISRRRSSYGTSSPVYMSRGMFEACSDEAATD